MEIIINKDIVKKMAKSADIMIGKNCAVLSKRRIKDILRTRRLKRDLFFWNNGALSWALEQYRAAGSEDILFANDGALLKKHRQMSLVDDTLYFYANYHRVSRVELDDVYNFLKNAKKDSVGSVMYRREDTAAFLDTIGMICPFLARYGNENENQQAIDLAMQQFRAFFTNGFDEVSGLPYHGYDVKHNLKCGVIGWGRGVGWLVVGLTETLRWLDPKSDEFTEVEAYTRRMFEVITKYQTTDGGFSWQLQAMQGHLDTSVVSMLGYSLAVYRKLTKNNIYEGELEKMVQCLLNNVNEFGEVLSSSAECRGFSMYPQRFETNSWGQGFGMLCVIEYLESFR